MTSPDPQLSRSPEAFDQDPDWPLITGRQLIKSGHVLDAVSHLEAALAARPGDPALNLQLGRAFMMLKRPGDARAHLRRALSSEGLRPVAWFELGKLEQECGRPARAAVAYQCSARARPTWFDAQAHAAQSMLAIGQRHSAILRARAAVDLRPESPHALRLLGVTLALTRRFAEAISVFESWSRAEPLASDPETYRARVLRLSGDNSAAQAACLTALVRRPSDVRALQTLARLALDAEDLAKAQIYLNKVVQLQPDRPMSRVRLGELFLKRERFFDAKQQARKALGLAPTLAPALALLVQAHLICGEILKARDALLEFDGCTGNDGGLGDIRAEVARRLEQRNHLPDKGRRGAGAAPPPLRFIPQARDPSAQSTWLSPRETRAHARLEFVEHLAILRALILKDLRIKYRGNSLGITLELLRPILVVGAHYYLFVLTRKPMLANLPILTFVIAGFPIWFAFNECLNVGIYGNQFAGPAMLLPRVTPFHIKFSKATWAVLLNFTFCICASWPMVYFFGQDLPEPNLALSAYIFIMAGAMGLGLGLLSEQLTKRWPIVDILVKLLGWALFVTSGQYFSLMTSERTWGAIVRFNPLLHLVEYERYAFDPGYPIALVSLGYPTAFAVSLMMLALMGRKAAAYRKAPA
jgi:ABC-type polysaccharide/polyol phosphate export permease/predicted Zn-dependent protease